MKSIFVQTVPTIALMMVGSWGAAWADTTDVKLPVPVIEFGVADIVRSGLCAMWVRAFAGARL